MKREGNKPTTASGFTTQDPQEARKGPSRKPSTKTTSWKMGQTKAKREEQHQNHGQNPRKCEGITEAPTKVTRTVADTAREPCPRVKPEGEHKARD